MKKTVCVVLSVCCALIFTGCALTTRFGSAETPQKEKSSLASSSKVLQKVKTAPEAENEFTISLAENPTTGYSWQWEIDDPSIVVLQNDYYEADNAKPGVAGSGGMRYLTFKCKKSGDTAITLTYSRPWKGGETAETREVSVSYQKGDTISWDMQKIR